MGSYLETPIDTYLGGDTHMRITCMSVGGRCRHSVIVVVRELLTKMPEARTVGDVKRRLKCRKCKARGWCQIDRVGRG